MRRHAPARTTRTVRAAWAVSIACALSVAWLPIDGPAGADVVTTVQATAVASNLRYPAMFTVAPDGDIFYAEAFTGRIGVIDAATGVDSTYYTVPALCATPGTDQGLFGLALHPDFAAGNPLLYFYAMRRGNGGNCQNQVGKLTPKPRRPGQFTLTVLLADVWVEVHNGGRLLFGPDRNLYISTGDGHRPADAPAATSRRGKILRMRPNGKPTSGKSYVFARGFRNVFGFDFDPTTGGLWAADNGPDGSDGGPPGPGPAGGCNDELNRVVAGGNYGWGATGSCATPPAPPLNSNRDGANPIMPALNIAVASGITGAAFCHQCGLGSDIEGRFLWGDFDYVNGNSQIHAAKLGPDRATISDDAVIFTPPGTAPLSIEQGPDGAIYYSDDTAIYRLASSP